MQENNGRNVSEGWRKECLGEYAVLGNSGCVVAEYLADFDNLSKSLRFQNET